MLTPGQRIRNHIIDKVWDAHLASISHKDPTLFWSLEKQVRPLPPNLSADIKRCSIIMGLMHDRLYSCTILPNHAAKDDHIDAILTVYRGRGMTPADFGVAVPLDSNFSAVCAILRSLNGNAAIQRSDVAADRLNDLMGDVDATAALMTARTPLDIIVLLRRAMDALVQATADRADQLATDDFIGLVAYALMQSGVHELESLSFYISNFVQSPLSPEHQWSLSTLSSAMAWLRQNPFDADVSNAPSASPSPAAEVPPTRPATLSEMRIRHTSSMSVASGGPVLSIHTTSSPPRRSASTVSLPSRAHSPTSLSLVQRAHGRIADVMLGPSAGEDRQSLYSRRLQSGRHVPTEISAGIDVRPRRRQSISEGKSFEHRRSSPEEMPPPTFPASRSAGPTQSRSGMSLDSSMLLTGMPTPVSIYEDDPLDSPHSGSVILQPPTPDVEVRPQIILRSPNMGRQPSRSYHMAVDFDLGDAAISRPTRAPLGRAQSHIGHAALATAASATDMRRSRSDGQNKRGNVDAWLFGRSPVSEGSASPRSSSPASTGHALERTLSMESDVPESSMWDWGRKRLSSVTSTGCESLLLP